MLLWAEQHGCTILYYILNYTILWEPPVLDGPQLGFASFRQLRHLVLPWL